MCLFVSHVALFCFLFPQIFTQQPYHTLGSWHVQPLGVHEKAVSVLPGVCCLQCPWGILSLSSFIWTSSFRKDFRDI